MSVNSIALVISDEDEDEDENSEAVITKTTFGELRGHKITSRTGGKQNSHRWVCLRTLASRAPLLLTTRRGSLVTAINSCLCRQGQTIRKRIE